MTSVDENRLKGNYASALVTTRLSSACLVRPVTADTDVGVDLYCETVENGKPFLHFWMQVKSGAQCNLLGDGTAACPFSTAHLEYWSRQPVPVFAALVPTGWPVGEEPRIHVVDVTSYLLSGDLDMAKQTQTLHSHDVWKPGDPHDVPYFLRTIVPQSTALLQCRQGVVTPIPKLTQEYFKAMPSPPVERFAAQLNRQVRTTAAWSIISMKRRGVVTSDGATELRRQMARVCSQFEHDPHWETHAAQGYSAHIDEAFEDAVAHYSRAIDIIDRDPHTDGENGWHYLREELVDLHSKAEQRLPYDPMYDPV